MNKIWGLFIFIGVTYGIFSGNISNVNNEIIKSAKDSLDIFTNIFPVIVLWLGIMTIAADSGLLIRISNLLNPLLKRIFPEIPKEDPTLGYISSNITANILGLGNASTPFGLKAMDSLQKLNNKKDTVSKSMTAFVLLNTSSLTLMPTTIISLRLFYKSTNPTAIIVPIIIITLICTIISLFIDKLMWLKNE